MKGSHALVVQSPYLKYEMEFHRNLTILQGDSATGKTTLVEMLQEYILNGSDTGIIVSCDCPCRVLSGSTWQEQLSHIHESIVFIDEGNRFTASEDFARAVRGSDNYYVIVTREGLQNLPYSVTEIYGIRSSGKYGSITPVYHHMYRIYGDFSLQLQDAYTSVLAEDSNSGFDFFSEIYRGRKTKCTSAQGAANIFDCLQDADEESGTIVIADGAAFGAHIGRIYKIMQLNRHIQLYLPESFEWLILSSDVLNDSEVRSILNAPEQYIDSRDYFSWERFFTALLTDKTRGTYMQYSKTKLNPVFLQGKYCRRIIQAMPMLLQRLCDSR